MTKADLKETGRLILELRFVEFLNWGQRYQSKDKGEEVKSVYLQNAGMLQSKSEGKKVVVGLRVVNQGDVSTEQG